MHLPDDTLSLPICGATWLLTAGGVWVGLKRLRETDIPKTGVLASTFFIATLISVPVPPGSVHLFLNGLMGMVLGWATFPAILLALLLQAIQFGHGGYTTLGANTLTMALPALMAYALFKRGGLGTGKTWVFVITMLTVACTCLMQAGLLWASGREFSALAVAVLVGNLPVLFLDAFFTTAVVGLLQKARPELLNGRDPEGGQLS
ncbi:MAG: cobalt transporter CbiM [Planctomycetota bacterium]